jgi:hypothetical protein
MKKWKDAFRMAAQLSDSNLLITMGEATETQNNHSISYYVDQRFQKIHVV